MPTVFQTRDRQGKLHPRWRFKYVDYLGVRRTATGTTSKQETKNLALQVQAKHNAIRKGWEPLPKTSDQPRPIGSAVDEYLAWGRAQGGHHGKPWSGKHLKVRTRHLDFWVRKLGLKLVGDLYGVLPEVEKILREKQEEGRVGKTLQNYSESIAAFCDWLLDREYVTSDPLKKLGGFDTTPVRVRRAFALAELQSLLLRCDPDHRTTYLVAVTTGLRRKELLALRRRHLDPVHKGLLLDGAWTKNRRSNFQPLPVGVFELLWEAQQFLEADGPILHVHNDAAGMIAADLVKAGVPRATDDGVLDFHSLRVTYTTMVIEVGASVKEAQALARHSSPDLTMNIYARTRSERLTEVVNKVGDMVAPIGNCPNCPTGVQQVQAPVQQVATTPKNDNGSNLAEAEKGGGSIPFNAPVDLRTLTGQFGSNFGQEHHVAHEADVESRTRSGFIGTTSGHEICPTVVERTEAIAGFSGWAPPPVVVATAFSGFSGFSGTCGVTGVA